MFRRALFEGTPAGGSTTAEAQAKPGHEPRFRSPAARTLLDQFENARAVPCITFLRRPAPLAARVHSNKPRTSA
jgi:hypothetical protein